MNCFVNRLGAFGSSVRRVSRSSATSVPWHPTPQPLRQCSCAARWFQVGSISSPTRLTSLSRARRFQPGHRIPRNRFRCSFRLSTGSRLFCFQIAGIIGYTVGSSPAIPTATSAVHPQADPRNRIEIPTLNADGLYWIVTTRQQMPGLVPQLQLGYSKRMNLATDGTPSLLRMNNM